MSYKKRVSPSNEETVSVAYRLPISEVNKLRTQAQLAGLLLSDYLRSITRRELDRIEQKEKGDSRK